MRLLRWVSPETFQRSALNLIKLNARLPIHAYEKKQWDALGIDTRSYTTFGMMLPREDQEYVFLFVVPPIDLREKKYRNPKD